MAITQKYLKNPDRFPGPDDGATWGDEEFWIDFVGGPYQVTGLSTIQWGRLAEHYADVRIDAPTSKNSHVRIQVRKIQSNHCQPLPAPPFLISFDLDAEPDHVRVAGWQMCGRIDCMKMREGTLWAATEDSWFTSNVFENFFRMVVTYRLLEGGGLLLHSAGVVNHGRAYLFPGRSGNGKSTLSRISLQEDRMVLSDDMNAVIWRKGEPWVEKVPFAGDLERCWTRSSSYPLAAIMALKKSDNTAVYDLPPIRAIARMIACAPYLNGDPFRAAMLLENLQKLTERAPTYILEFTLKKGIWPVLEEIMQP